MSDKALFRFSKDDFTWSYIAIVAAAVAVVGLSVVKPALTWAIGGPLRADVPLEPGDLVDDDMPGLTASRGVIELAGAPASGHLWVIALGAAFSGVVLFVLVLLWRFVRACQLGEPFVAANVRRLKWMGASLLVLSLVAVPVQGFANAYLRGLVLPGLDEVWYARFDSTMAAVAAFGVLLALVAEVFTRGEELEGDVEGLV